MSPTWHTLQKAKDMFTECKLEKKRLENLRYIIIRNRTQRSLLFGIKNTSLSFKLQCCLPQRREL